MARFTLVTALAFMAFAVAPLTHATSVQPTMPVVVAASASLKFVSTRVAGPVASAKAAVMATAHTIDNDGDRFRYDSCGCSAP